MKQGLKTYKGTKAKKKPETRTQLKDEIKVKLSAIVDLDRRIRFIDRTVKKVHFNQPLSRMVEQFSMNNEIGDIARDVKLLKDKGEVKRYIDLLDNKYPDRSSKIGVLVRNVVIALEMVLDLFDEGNPQVAKRGLEELAEALLPS